MSLSVFNIKKWYKMIIGKSILHVNQNLGKCFNGNDVYGYYNNLIDKVLMQPELLDTDMLPVDEQENGDKILFPIAIFQYGLGAYDLYLQTKEEKYLLKFSQCVKWTVENQIKSGAWETFIDIYPESPYSAMAQGEAISLLIRAYKESGDYLYVDAAKKAAEFMLKPIEEGGTTIYNQDDVLLAEYTHLPVVLNGWIFAWWGLHDLLLVNDIEEIRSAYERSLTTIIKYLPYFSEKYWSMYDLGEKIASPFYHRLHIAQMQAMYQITKVEIFNEYAIRWSNYYNNKFYKSFAFLKKAYQKILE